MTRRASLPGADELFRRTTEAPAEVRGEQTEEHDPKSISLQVAKDPTPKLPRHDEKVTFYCKADDLTRLERARLELRADHRISSDRGRIVRAALEEMLDDFETRGANSALVKRLHR